MNVSSSPDTCVQAVLVMTCLFFFETLTLTTLSTSSLNRGFMSLCYLHNRLYIDLVSTTPSTVRDYITFVYLPFFHITSRFCRLCPHLCLELWPLWLSHDASPFNLRFCLPHSLRIPFPQDVKNQHGGIMTVSVFFPWMVQPLSLSTYHLCIVHSSSWCEGLYICQHQNYVQVLDRSTLCFLLMFFSFFFLLSFSLNSLLRKVTNFNGRKRESVLSLRCRIFSHTWSYDNCPNLFEPYSPLLLICSAAPWV